MDESTLFEMQNALDSVKTRADKAIQEINQDKYQNALLLLMAMILDLFNVAFDLNRHLLYRKIKE